MANIQIEGFTFVVSTVFLFVVADLLRGNPSNTIYLLGTAVAFAGWIVSLIRIAIELAN